MRMVVAAAIVLAAAGCGGGAEVRVPPVDTGTLGHALKAMRAAGLRVEASPFGPLPPGTTLDGAAVGDQDPEPGTRVAKGSTVRLNMMGFNPIGSMAVLDHRPRYVVVPDVVGLNWSKARTRLDGLVPWIRAVDSLPASESSRGLAAYVITGQTPRAGTRMRHTGYLVRRGPHRGFHPSFIRLTIGVG